MDVTEQPTGSTTIRGEAETRSIRPPSIWDDDAPLLGGIPRPLFHFRFSVIAIVRLMIIPLAITDFVFEVQPVAAANLAVASGFFTMALLLWNIIALLAGVIPVAMRNKGPLKLSFGPLTCILERKSVPSHRRPIAVMAVDLIFAGLALVPLITAAAGESWRPWYSDYKYNITGLSAAVLGLQFALVVLNAFAVFRKVKICVYNDDEKAMMQSIHLPRD